MGLRDADRGAGASHGETPASFHHSRLASTWPQNPPFACADDGKARPVNTRAADGLDAHRPRISLNHRATRKFRFDELCRESGRKPPLSASSKAAGPPTTRPLVDVAAVKRRHDTVGDHWQSPGVDDHLLAIPMSRITLTLRRPRSGEDRHDEQNHDSNETHGSRPFPLSQAPDSPWDRSMSTSASGPIRPKIALRPGRGRAEPSQSHKVAHFAARRLGTVDTGEFSEKRLKREEPAPRRRRRSCSRPEPHPAWRGNRVVLSRIGVAAPELRCRRFESRWLPGWKTRPARTS